MNERTNQSNSSTPSIQPRSGRFWTLLLVGGVLLVETAALVGILTFAGGPSKAEAAGDAQLIIDEDSGERVVEILVLDARLENNRSGMTHVFDTEIWVQTRSRNRVAIEHELSRLHNEIRAEINVIWKSSEPRHLREAGFETITRRMHQLLGDRFGHDPVTGEPIILKCVIVAGTGFRADA